MELLQLWYFREIAHSGHLSRTAEKLHIAQPSLSQMLKRLENELGLSLFDRIGKRLVLNENGIIFLKYTDRIFSALNNAKLELAEHTEKKEKQVTLCVSSASLLLPEIVKQIQKADPHIHLRIVKDPEDAEEGLPMLRLYSAAKISRKIKAKSSKTESGKAERGDDTKQILMIEPIRLLLPKSHPLAEKETLLAEDLKGEPFISLGVQSDLAQIIRTFTGEIVWEPEITTYVDSPAMMRQFLKLNLGCAFVPEYTWYRFAEDTAVLKAVHDLPMERYLIMEWDPDSYQTEAFILCKNIITDYFIKYNRRFRSTEEV